MTSDENGVTDIGDRIARDSRGRIISYTKRGELTIWSSGGSVIGSFGRAGAGPGEFAPGPLSVHVGPADSLFVLDNSLRWTVLSPSLTLARSVQVGAGSAVPGKSVVLSSGELLSTGRDGAFAITSLSERSQLRRSFGPVVRKAADYTLSYPGGNTFWALNRANVVGGYTIEGWSTSGTQTSSIKREVSWMGDNPASQGGGKGAPPPTVGSFHVDASGIAFVVYSRSTPRWRYQADRSKREAMEDAGFEVFLDVIDLNTGALLATQERIAPSKARAEMPVRFLSGSRTAYWRTSDPDGHTRLSLARVTLIPNPARR